MTISIMTNASMTMTRAKSASLDAKNNKKQEFSRSKLVMSLDYIFGKSASRGLDNSEIGFVYSRRTGRLKHVVSNVSSSQGRILFSFRPNGSIAPTVAGFSILLSKFRLGRISSRPRWTITVIDGVSEVVSRGKTVFCKHVVDCSDLLRAGEDIAVLNEKGDLLAVGRTILSGPTIKQFKRGAAVKVREGSVPNNAIADEL